MKIRLFLGALLTIAASAAFAQTYSWDQSSIALNEASGSVTVNIQRSATAAQPVTVYFNHHQGTALTGNGSFYDDYTISPSSPVTFQPGDLSKPVVIQILDDDIYEGAADETIILNLQGINPSAGATIGIPSQVQITIAENDLAAFMRLDADSYTVSEAGGVLPVTVLRSGDTSGTSNAILQARWMLTNADPDVDFDAMSLVVTFGPGETTQVVNVSIYQDTEYEGTEAFEVILGRTNSSGPPVNGAIASPSLAGAHITDDDPPAIFTMSSDAYSVAENAGPLVVTVNRGGSTTNIARVQLSTTVAVSPAVHATAGQDYSSTSVLVEFAPGETTKDASIPIADDGVYEGDEQFRVVLSAPSGGVIQAPTSATVTIAEDDVPPVISFSNPPYSVDENNPSGIDVTVTRTGQTTGESRVVFTTQDITAKRFLDFTEVNDWVVFAPGETSKTVHVAIANDNLDEGSETFHVWIRNPQNAVIGGADREIVTIVDDDAGIPPQAFQFSQPHYSVFEGGSTTITLLRTSGVGYETSVTVTSSPNFAYTPQDLVLNFAASDTQQSFDITIPDDQDPEAAREHQMWLAQHTDVRADFTFEASDNNFAFSSPRYFVNEGAGFVTVRVQRTSSETSPSRIEVKAEGGGGTAVAGSDYDWTTEALFFGSETYHDVTIPIFQDALVEGTEEFNVNLQTVPPTVVVVEIDDDDDAPAESSMFRLGSGSYTVDESSSSVTVTILRYGDTSGTQTVTLATRAVTAEAEDDFATTARSIQFEPGMTQQEIEIPIVGDSSAEPTESFEVDLAGPGVSEVAVVIIADDDAPAPQTFQYLSGANALALDLYAPATSGQGLQTLPVIIWIDSEGSEPEAIRQLDRGYAVVVVHYRPFGSASHPDPLTDVVAAIQWLRAHDHELGIDTSRIVVWGKGAGGYLAAHAATTGWARGAIVWAAPSDLAAFRDDSVCGTDSGMPARILGCTPAQCPSKAAAANPAANASPIDPPFLIMHGEADCVVPVQQSRRLATALSGAGVNVTLRTYPGVSHDDGFWGSRAAMQEVEAFLDRIQAAKVRRRSVR